MVYIEHLLSFRGSEILAHMKQRVPMLPAPNRTLVAESLRGLPGQNITHTRWCIFITGGGRWTQKPRMRPEVIQEAASDKIGPEEFTLHDMKGQNV